MIRHKSLPSAHFAGIRVSQFLPKASPGLTVTLQVMPGVCCVSAIASRPCTKSWLCQATQLHPLQVLFKCLLYPPYVSHPLHDFVDLLFLSNISCILLTGRVSGHYIHGRNQSQYSDTSLQASRVKRACMHACCGPQCVPLCPP